MILLNPGPVTLSPGVRAALSAEDMCHREQAFATLTRDICVRLERVYPDAEAAYAAVVLTGSGSAAVEAMLSTFSAHDRPTLVVCNGVYGERMLQMLQQQRKPMVVVQGAWEKAIDVAAVQAALETHPGISTLAVVHHETTTGRLNSLDAIASLCRDRGVSLLLDAVSSFGGEALPFADWQPLAVAATGNKCLHGVPGVSFVLARREALEVPNGYSTTLYLDLERYYSAQKDGWSPFTQAVQCFFALREALIEFENAGGWQRRRSRYSELSDSIGQWLKQRGVMPLLAEGCSAAMLRAYALPDRMSYASLHDRLLQQGFTIYAGQGHLASDVFRIATMGAIQDSDRDHLLSVLEDIFSPV